MIHIRRLTVICLILLSFPHLVLASKTHVARRSESLHSIARKYHVSVDELKSVNNLSSTRIEQGARIIIPSHAEQKTAKAAKPQSYKVAKGDTLPRIAKKTGTKMSDLRRLNGLKGNRIKVGQVLALNEPAPAAEE